MLHRCTLWLRRTWQKLPMQLSVLGWPPILSHSLAFIIGTLVLQRSDAALLLPAGKILVPVDKLGKLETEGKSWKEPQKLTVLVRQADQWCRTGDETLNLWKGPGRGADLYVVWPTALAPRLQQTLQKKAVLTLDSKTFAFCGKATPDAQPSGILYD